MKAIGEITVNINFSVSEKGVKKYQENPTMENLLKIVLEEAKAKGIDYTRVKVVNNTTDKIEVCLK